MHCRRGRQADIGVDIYKGYCLFLKNTTSAIGRPRCTPLREGGLGPAGTGVHTSGPIGRGSEATEAYGSEGLRPEATFGALPIRDPRVGWGRPHPISDLSSLETPPTTRADISDIIGHAAVGLPSCATELATAPEIQCQYL